MGHSHKSSTNIIIAVLTAFIFLNFTIYLPNEGFFPFPAYLLDISIFLFLLGYYIKKRLLLPFENIFFIWVVYFLSLNIIYYLASPGGTAEIALLKVIIFLTFVYIYVILLFALDNRNLTIMRTTLVVIAPIITLTLGIDYFNPGYFASDPSYIIVQGRAASFYRNANYAGSSIIIILVLGMDMVPKKSRLLFLLVIFLGLFFTMSRSNLITFFIIIFIMFFQKKLYAKQLLLSMTFIVIFFIWVSTSGLDTISQKYDLEITENMKSRVNFFADNATSNTSDMDERKDILHDALEIFQDNPIFGAGLGATLFWEHRVGPHNTFAMVAADQGLFGLLLIVLLFFFSTYYVFKYGDTEQKQLAILFLIAYTLSCFFSHDRLSQTTAIVFMIAISTIGYKMKLISKE